MKGETMMKVKNIQWDVDTYNGIASLGEMMVHNHHHFQSNH